MQFRATVKTKDGHTVVTKWKVASKEAMRKIEQHSYSKRQIEQIVVDSIREGGEELWCKIPGKSNYARLELSNVASVSAEIKHM